MGNKSKGINEARMKTMYRRHAFPSWGPDYLPAILATVEEAPSISHALTLTPAKLDVREAHLLSLGEGNSGFLGLYHPRSCGLQEQRTLFPEACEHPLATFPGIDKTILRPLKGIIDVAERLGYLDLLPKINVANRDVPCEQISLVFPWVGDLLWAIRDLAGKVFCINWTVKDTYLDFKRPAAAQDGKTRETRKNLGRHEIEKVYYGDAEIRTVQVANEAIDRNVAANLRHLFLHHRRDLGLREEQREEIHEKYAAALEAGIPPFEVIIKFSERGRYTVDQCRSLLWQLIWNRQLRIDLFQPILINRPLRHETRDVIDVYADWFKE